MISQALQAFKVLSSPCTLHLPVLLSQHSKSCNSTMAARNRNKDKYCKMVKFVGLCNFLLKHFYLLEKISFDFSTPYNQLKLQKCFCAHRIQKRYYGKKKKNYITLCQKDNLHETKVIRVSLTPSQKVVRIIHVKTWIDNCQQHQGSKKVLSHCPRRVDFPSGK